MAHVVGIKGQIVIAKEIRDRLGVKHGWLTFQKLVDDHVEIYFLPPEHRKSLKGSLAEHIKVSVAPGREWDESRDIAWDKTAKQKSRCRGVVILKGFLDTSGR